MIHQMQETRPINSFLPEKKPHSLKYDLVTSSRKMFNKFKDLYPAAGVTYQQYRQIIEALNMYYLEYVLETGDIAILPHGMGKIMVEKQKARLRKSKNSGIYYMQAPVDWNKSNKEGKIVYFLNEETGGFTYRYTWFNKASYIKHSPLYFMIMTQQAKKMLKSRIEYTEKNYQALYKDLLTASKNRLFKKAEKK